MVKIAHIVKSSHNIGEGALINGMHSSMKEDSNLDLEFDCIDRKLFQSMHGHEFSHGSVSKRFDISFAEELNKNYDLLLIGGGGIFQSGEYDNLGGMAIAGDLDAFDSLKIPWVVYGVGDNRFDENEEFKYGDDLARLIQISKRSKNGIISFRNDLSKERLKKYIPNNLIESVYEIPDSGLYIKVSEKKHPLIRGEKINIVLNLAGDRIQKRLAINDKSKIINMKSDFIKKILDAIEMIAKKKPINVIIAPHIPSDYSIVLELIKDASLRRYHNSGLIRELFDINYCTRGFEKASDFFGLYHQADLSIVMRGHGAICSAGIGTPFISIDAHPKVSGFMKDFGLQKYSISPSTPNFDSKLLDITLELLDDNGFWRKKRNLGYNLARETTKNFNKLVFKLLKRKTLA